MRKRTDCDLIRDYVESGSQAAFAELIRRYLPLVYGICKRHLHNPTLAKDAAQVVFLVLSRKASDLRSLVVLSAWLSGVCRLVARNVQRSEAARLQRDQIMTDDAQRQSETHDTQIGVDDLENALATLAPADRQAVLLRFITGYSYAEAGQASGISEEAARKRVSRALEKLRRHFAQAGFLVNSITVIDLMHAHKMPARLETHFIDTILTQLTGLGGSATVISPLVHTLTQGVINSMRIAKYKTICALASVVLVAGGSGIYVASGHVKSPPQKTSNTHKPVLRTKQKPAGIAETKTELKSLTTDSIEQMQLGGPFTLTYNITRRNVMSAETKMGLLKKWRIPLDIQVKNHEITQNQMDDQMKQSAASLNISGESGTITLSSLGGRTFCRETGMGAGNPGHISVYDGKQTLEYTQAAHYLQRIDAGLRYGIIHPTLIPGVGTPYAPLIQTPTIIEPPASGGTQRFSGDVMMLSGKAMPGVVEATIVDGKSKALSLIVYRRLDKSFVVARWDFLEHQQFEGVWIASHMMFTTYEQTGPVDQYDLHLSQASNQAMAEEQFQIGHWLTKGDTLFYGDQRFVFDPSKGGLEEQAENERLIEIKYSQQANPSRN